VRRTAIAASILLTAVTLTGGGIAAAPGATAISRNSGSADRPGRSASSSAPTSCTGTSGCVAGGRHTSTVATATQFEVTAPASTEVGVPVSVRIAALDASGARVSSFGGAVHFTSTDPKAVLPPNARLDGGAGSFTVVFGTSGSQTVTATDVTDTSITGTSAAVSVDPNVQPSGNAITLTAYSGVGGIVLAWNQPVAGPGIAITSYGVLRGTASGAESTTPLAVLDGTSYVDQHVTPGVRYYYKVVAHISNGGGLRSNQAWAVVSGNLAGGRRITGLPGGGGYWLAGPDGGVFPHGNARSYGSLAGTVLDAPVVGLASTPDGKGYWLVESNGEIYPFGDAHDLGSLAGQPPASPIVSMTVLPDGTGYWLVSADGTVYAFGDAQPFGSVPAADTAIYSIVYIAVTPSGLGYWLVDQDGTVYAFGDARSLGSAPHPGGRRLNQPIVDMVVTSDGSGYWLTGGDGAVYAFGDAHFFGSLAQQIIVWPIVGMVAAPGGKAYSLINTVGDAKYFAS
jgi:hypothetical protein